MTPALSSPGCPACDASADENLSQRIRLFFEALNLVSLRRIHVKVKNGSVQIEGAVRSYYERQLALSCVQRVAGVRQGKDLIVVDANAVMTRRQFLILS